MKQYCLSLQAFALVVSLAWASEDGLIESGAVGEYRPGQQSGPDSFNRQTPPQQVTGFFVGASSIRSLNGMYANVEDSPTNCNRRHVRLYKHDYTGWLMSYGVDASDPEGSPQWMFVDSDGNDRFRCPGCNEFMPGGGRSWQHVHNARGSTADTSTGTAVSTHVIEDDLEEIPWQMIGVMGQEHFDKLRDYFKLYKHEVQVAIEGDQLLGLTMGGSEETDPPNDFAPITALTRAIEEDAAGRDGCTAEGVETSALEDALEQARSTGHIWAQATVMVRLGTCLRRSRSFAQAHQYVTAALELRPRFKAALLEQGIASLDQGCPRAP